MNEQSTYAPGDAENLRAELLDTRAELSEARAEIAELKDELRDLEEADDEPDFYCDHDGYVDEEIVAEIRRLIHRKQYDDAIELADRNLPGRLRYAA
jgi:chromosome segregation ATPase